MKKGREFRALFSYSYFNGYFRMTGIETTPLAVNTFAK